MSNKKRTYQVLIVAQSSGNVATSISTSDTYEEAEEVYKQANVADDTLSTHSGMKYRVYRLYKKA